jgi:hypothetical protein
LPPRVTLCVINIRPLMGLEFASFAAKYALS